jgi:hypothetical protein
MKRAGIYLKTKRTKTETSRALFRRKPNGPAHTVSRGGKRNKMGADRWGRDVSPLNKSRIGKLSSDQDRTARVHLLPQHGRELTCE